MPNGYMILAYVAFWAIVGAIIGAVKSREEWTCGLFMGFVGGPIGCILAAWFIRHD